MNRLYEYLTTWTQNGPEDNWLRYASVQVDLEDLPAPVIAPVDRETIQRHRDASEALIT